MSTMRRHSKKRDAILSCIRRSHLHPSAEWIYTQLKPEHPDLSLGTVYRNLALFRESGEIVCVATVHGVERLDAVTEQYGCTVQRSEMLFRGVCARCKNKDI